MANSTSYITNLINAFRGKPYFQIVKLPQEIKWKTLPAEVVYTKDPQGLIKRDLAIIKQYSNTRPFKVGDPLELVAYKAGQADLIRMIETKLVAPKIAQLQEH